MVQGRDAPGFTVEPLEELWIRSKPRGQDLDGHDAIQAAVAGFVDLAHAPGTEGRVDPIGTEERTGGKRMLERAAGFMPRGEIGLRQCQSGRTPQHIT